MENAAWRAIKHREENPDAEKVDLLAQLMVFDQVKLSANICERVQAGIFLCMHTHCVSANQTRG